MQDRSVIGGPGAWIGSQIQRDPSWIYRFDDAALAEIDAALAHAQRAGARIPFAPEAFPLPTLATALDRILDEIEHGRGFALLRGIPRSRYTDEECALVYWGL